MTTFHAIHVGSASRAAALILRGWQLLSPGIEPVSPCIDGDWWLAIGNDCPIPSRIGDGQSISAAIRHALPLAPGWPPSPILSQHGWLPPPCRRRRHPETRMVRGVRRRSFLQRKGEHP